MAKAGRPPVLDEGKLREICAMFAIGCRTRMAARYVGCSLRTLEREFQRNEEFRNRVLKAQVGAQVTPLDALRKASATHWRAAAWLLERGYPTDFGRKPPDVLPIDEVKNIVSRLISAVAEAIPDPEVKERIGRSIKKAFCEEVKRKSRKRKRRTREEPLTLRGLDRCRSAASRSCSTAGYPEVRQPHSVDAGEQPARYELSDDDRMPGDVNPVPSDENVAVASGAAAIETATHHENEAHNATDSDTIR